MIRTGEPNPNDSNNSYLNNAESTNQDNNIQLISKKYILVVDDDEWIRAFLYETLSRQGYEVVTASGGAEGLEQFSRNSFDLVITDCIMPGTDGWQVAELIKQTSAHTPIIMITGLSKDDIMDKVQDGDIDFLIFKPIKLDTLYEAVRASFELERS